jgi:molybdenum cofactor synthesis domain-containing protein
VTDTALVITVSTRAAAGVYEDTSGPVVYDGLIGLGYAVSGPVVVPDGDAVGEALRAAVAADHAVVITTGGTGLNPRDNTPEQTSAVLDREIPHLAAAIARYGVEHGVATAVLSRGLAGVSGRTLIINLPGSRGGARDGMAVLAPVLAHAVSQLRGGDH